MNLQGWYRYGTNKAHFFNRGYPLCGNAAVRTNDFWGLLKPFTGLDSEKCKSCAKQHKKFEWDEKKARGPHGSLEIIKFCMENEEE